MFVRVAVGVNVEVGVGVKVEVGVGENSDQRICPGPQLVINRLIAHNKMINANFLLLTLISFFVIGIQNHR